MLHGEHFICIVLAVVAVLTTIMIAMPQFSCSKWLRSPRGLKKCFKAMESSEGSLVLLSHCYRTGQAAFRVGCSKAM